MGNPNDSYAYPTGAAAPPPYATPEHTARSSSPAPSYQTLAASGSGISGVANRMPQSLNAYLPPLTKWSRLMYLGAHADQPFFAVTTHTGLSGKPLLEMHAGPTGSEPVVATAGNEHRWSSGRNTIVKLIPGGGYLEGQAESTFTMKETCFSKHYTFPFAVEVGLGKDTRLESFEWRGSRGEEVKQLDGASWRGYKLVRLDGAAAGPGGARAVRGEGESSDGKEVVAVYTANAHFSRNKIFKFQFLESGATGILGEKFALAAVITACKIGYSEFLVSQSTVAAAS
ncbi:hypothetical protein F5B19DRAFT_466942 [Rostrohypoxylon terebratum]|nr:hypothetical protein F5B19DRAFT_466942 [Rostrohypoxylon terebratum]